MTTTVKNNKDKNAFDMYKWIKACRPYHLTLSDVLKWKKGEKYDVCMLDRQFEEYGDIWNNVKPDTIFSATTFFAKNKATLTYEGNLVWNITYDYGETLEHPVHLCMSGLATSWHWAAIEDGKVHINGESLREGVPFPSHREAMYIPWQDFPKATRVGWRGPMLMWSHLNVLPPVYWHRK